MCVRERERKRVSLFLVEREVDFEFGEMGVKRPGRRLTRGKCVRLRGSRDRSGAEYSVLGKLLRGINLLWVITCLLWFFVLNYVCFWNIS